MADDSILQVTDASFDADVLESDVPVLLDIWADWCWPCRMMAPILDEMAAELKGKVRIAKLDSVDKLKYRVASTCKAFRHRSFSRAVECWRERTALCARPIY